MDDQLFTYLFLRNNIYYYSRRVPLDMECHYGSKRIVKSLKTRSKRTALRGSNQINFQLETYWCSIRVEQLTKGLVSAPVAKVIPDGCGYDLLDARDNYLTLEGKDHVFERTAARTVNYFIEAVGNRGLNDYTSTDGAKFIGFLLGRWLAVGSIKHIFSSHKALDAGTCRGSTTQGISCHWASQP
jgi:hypothetical protein